MIYYSFAAFNSYKSGSQSISVPYPKSNLEIETLTFRDKLQQGTDETWQFKIKGPYGEKVSAELLASMYDASLNQFKPHDWTFNPIQNKTYYSGIHSRASQGFGTSNFRVYNNSQRLNYPKQNYDQWNWFGFSFGNNNSLRYSSLSKTLSGRVAGVQIVEDAMEVEETVMFNSEADLDEVVVVGYGVQKKKDLAGSPIDQLNNGKGLEEQPNFDNIKIRKNLQETTFFFPHLKTDETGNVSFSFTTPEALTQWKLQLLAHTKTLESATQSLTTVTQKELMVIPNAPRFLREGDQITISTKIANLTDKELSGQAVLVLTDAISGKDINANLSNSENNKTFSVDANGNIQIYAKMYGTHRGEHAVSSVSGIKIIDPTSTQHGAKLYGEINALTTTKSNLSNVLQENQGTKSYFDSAQLFLTGKSSTLKGKKGSTIATFSGGNLNVSDQTQFKD